VTYETPRITFVGSDPKIARLQRAIAVNAAASNLRGVGMAGDNNPYVRRFVRLWQARNRRTRVLMYKVQRANLG
jgi:hypothetical protein